MLRKEIKMKDGYAVNSAVCSIRSIPVHIHQAFEIIFVLKGSLTVSCFAFQYELREGDVFIANVNEPHHLKSDGENLVLLFHVDPYQYENIFPNLSYYWFLCDSYRDEKKESTDLIRLQKMLLNAATFFHSGKKEECGNTTVNIISHLINRYQNISFTGRDLTSCRLGTDDTLTIRRAFQIQEFIYRHYKDKISLEDISAHLYLNKSYVSRLIRNFTGLNCTDLIGFLRTEKAQILLLTTDLPIQEISCECGFSKTSYLKKHFSAWYGMSPSEYRNTMLPEMSREPECTVIPFDSPETEAARGRLLKDENYETSSYNRHYYKIDLNGTYSAFDHRWNKIIRISDVMTACKNIDPKSMSVYQEEIGFDTVVIGNIFNRFSGDAQQRIHLCDRLAHLLKTLLTMGVRIIVEVVPHEEDVDQFADALETAFAAMDHDLLRKKMSAPSAFSVRINSYSLNRSKTTMTHAVKRIDEMLHKFGIGIPIEVTNRSPAKESYTYDSMSLVPEVIRSALQLENGSYTAYRELFDIPERETGVGLPALSHNGLLGAFGEKKPVYYAWQMLSYLGHKKGFVGEGLLVTKEGDNHILLLYDCERGRTYGDDAARNGLIFRLKLKSLPYRRYSVTQITLESGNSLFRQLEKLGFPQFLTESDVNFINKATEPQIRFSVMDVKESENTIDVPLNSCSAKILILKPVSSQ